MPKNVKNARGKTIEEAIESGLAQMGLSREEVNIEVVREGKRGVFGLGSEDAEVRLIMKETETPAAPQNPVRNSISTSKKEDPAKKRMAEFAMEHLQHILKHMGIKAEVSWRIAPDLVEEEETPPIVLDVTGHDLGILIGRRSETLQALQYLVRLMVSKQISKWQPIMVDVESYRVRRRRSLHQIAQRMAERAANSGRTVSLEAMSPYERRIVHIALKNHPDVYTKSIGSNDNRKVTIIPK